MPLGPDETTLLKEADRGRINWSLVWFLIGIETGTLRRAPTAWKG